MNKKIGYISGGTPVIEADIITAVNEATSYLEGNIVWDSFEYTDSGNDPRILIWGLDDEETPVVYRLCVVVDNNEIWTTQQAAPLYTTCVTQTCCATCGLYTNGTCYCKTTAGCSPGSCETRNYGWIGSLSDVAIDYY